MKILNRSLVVLSLLCSFSLVQGQEREPDSQSTMNSISTEKSRREIVQEERLKKLFSKVGVSVAESRAISNQSQIYREMKIRWTDSASVLSGTETRPSISKAEQEPALGISVVEEQKRFGTLPRQRSLELSPTHILIAAVDEKNQLRWWSIMLDPRVVRAEFQTSTGELRSENYYLSNLTVGVAFPDDPKIVSLRFYHPLWTGTDFDLKLLAIVPVQ